MTQIVLRPDLAETSAQRAKAALLAGNTETALKEIDGILDEEKPIHDLYGDMCASFLTFIAQRLGEAAVDESWRYVAADVWQPVIMYFKSQNDLPGLAVAFAKFLISHRYDFEVIEDEEKWSFEVKYCSSGERMVVEGKVQNNGGNPNGHHHFGATSRPYPLVTRYAELPLL